MVLDSAETYLVVTVAERAFALPLGLVAGVETLSGDEAERLGQLGVVAWQGYYCPMLDIESLGQKPAAGDTVIILELPDGRKGLVCGPRTYFKEVAERLPVPKLLTRRHPLVKEAFWDADRLVHCLAMDQAAAA